MMMMMDACGYRVVKVRAGSPAELAGLQVFFDFVVEVNDIAIKKDDGFLLDVLRTYVGNDVFCVVYNAKSQETRTVVLRPSSHQSLIDENSIGALFAFMKLSSVVVAQIECIACESPASKAGLCEKTDFIMGRAAAMLDKPLKLFIYNIVVDSIRQVKVDKYLQDTEKLESIGVLLKKGDFDLIRKQRKQLNESHISGYPVPTAALPDPPPPPLNTGDQMQNIVFDLHSESQVSSLDLAISKHSTVLDICTERQGLLEIDGSREHLGIIATHKNSKRCTRMLPNALILEEKARSKQQHGDDDVYFSLHVFSNVHSMNVWCICCEMSRSLRRAAPDRVEQLLQHCASGDVAGIVRLVCDSNTGDCFNIDMAKDSKGNNPLIIACAYSQLHVVNYLLHVVHVDVSSVDFNGATALMHAAAKRNPDVVKTLIEASADVDAVANNGETAVHYAARHDCIENLHLLYQANANIEARDKNGWNALMAAASYGKMDAVDWLLDRDVSLGPNDAGVSALFLAADGGHSCIVSRLVKLKADPNLATLTGWTPLMAAAAKNHPEVVEMLLSSGARTTAIHNMASISEPCGIGVAVRKTKQGFVIRSVDVHGPAYRNLMTNDQLLSIDGISLVFPLINYVDASDLLLGEDKSQVRIEFCRGDVVHTVKLTRRRGWGVEMMPWDNDAIKEEEEHEKEEEEEEEERMDDNIWEEIDDYVTNERPEVGFQRIRQCVADMEDTVKDLVHKRMVLEYGNREEEENDIGDGDEERMSPRSQAHMESLLSTIARKRTVPIGDDDEADDDEDLNIRDVQMLSEIARRRNDYSMLTVDNDGFDVSEEEDVDIIRILLKKLLVLTSSKYSNRDELVNALMETASEVAVTADVTTNYYSNNNDDNSVLKPDSPLDKASNTDATTNTVDTIIETTIDTTIDAERLTSRSDQEEPIVIESMTIRDNSVDHSVDNVVHKTSHQDSTLNDAHHIANGSELNEEQESNNSSKTMEIENFRTTFDIPDDINDSNDDDHGSSNHDNDVPPPNSTNTQPIAISSSPLSSQPHTHSTNRANTIQSAEDRVWSLLDKTGGRPQLDAWKPRRKSLEQTASKTSFHNINDSVESTKLEDDDDDGNDGDEARDLIVDLKPQQQPTPTQQQQQQQQPGNAPSNSIDDSETFIPRSRRDTRDQRDELFAEMAKQLEQKKGDRSKGRGRNTFSVAAPPPRLPKSFKNLDGVGGKLHKVLDEKGIFGKKEENVFGFLYEDQFFVFKGKDDIIVDLGSMTFGIQGNDPECFLLSDYEIKAIQDRKGNKFQLTAWKAEFGVKEANSRSSVTFHAQSKGERDVWLSLFSEKQLNRRYQIVNTFSTDPTIEILKTQPSSSLSLASLSPSSSE